MPSDIVLLRSGLPLRLPMRRTPGVHVSVIIKALCVYLGHFSADWGEQPESELHTRWEAGNIWETGLIARKCEDDPDRFTRPGELVGLSTDGHTLIYGTPDLVDVIDECVEEIKLTWSSSNNDPDDSQLFWRYWRQGMAYAYMLGYRRVRLDVGFAAGNYTYPLKPDSRLWEREFTQSELESNWAMLCNNIDRAYYLNTGGVYVPREEAA